MDPPAGSTVRIPMTRKEKTIIARADGRAPRATATRPAMTPRPPAPAAVHNEKVTSGIDGCRENHHGRAGRGSRYVDDGHAGASHQYRDHDGDRDDDQDRRDPRQTRLSRSRAGRERSLAAGAAGGSSARRRSSGVARSVRHQPFVLAPGAALRTESAREAPGYAERDGSLPLPNLLAIPCLPNQDRQ